MSKGMFPTTHLGEIVTFLDHKRVPVKESERRSGPFPYYGANGQQGWIDGYLFDEPLVLLAEDGGHFYAPDRGIAYRVSGRTWVNNHAHVLRPKAVVDLAFLCRVLENYDVTPFLTGTTRGKLTQAGAARIPVPLPPLQEQRRIAAVLDRTDALRTQRRVALERSETLKQSLFLEMFGDVVRNERHWHLVPFGSVCESRLGKMVDQKRETGRYAKPYLRNANVQWFGFDLSAVDEMDFHPEEQEKFRLKPGNLIICEGGHPGRAAIWTGEMEECYYQKALHRGKVLSGRATPEYLVWLLWFLVHFGGLKDHVTSATISHLTGVKLKSIRIPLPPLNRQEEFARRLVEVDKVSTTLSASLVGQDVLFASLQRRAFAGAL